MATDKRLERPSIIVSAAVAALLFLGASEVSAQQVPAVLDCSAAQPQTSPAINYPIMFTRTGRKQLDAETADWHRRAAAIARLLKAEA